MAQNCQPQTTQRLSVWWTMPRMRGQKKGEAMNGTHVGAFMLGMGFILAIQLLAALAIGRGRGE